MKYYIICKQILGYEIFSKLIDTILLGIIKKFGKEITVNEFGKILEINIDVLMMISISNRFPNKNEYVSEQIEIGLPYLITDTIEDFKREMDYYINIISQKL